MSPLGHSQATQKQNRSGLIPALIPDAACPADGWVRQHPQLLLHIASTLYKQGQAHATSGSSHVGERRHIQEQKGRTLNLFNIKI